MYFCDWKATNDAQRMSDKRARIVLEINDDDDDDDIDDEAPLTRVSMSPLRNVYDDYDDNYTGESSSEDSSMSTSKPRRKRSPPPSLHQRVAAKKVCEHYTLPDLLCMINVMIDGDSIDYTTETFDHLFRLTAKYKQLEKKKKLRAMATTERGYSRDGLTQQQRLKF